MAMKLGKEEQQKIILGVLLLAAMLYGYFEMLLAPVKTAKVRIQTEIATLNQQIRDASSQIRQTEAKEASVPDAERVVRQVRSMIPEGAPVAWFPTHVAEHFKRQGVDRAATRLNSEQVDKDLTGFRRMFWSIDLAAVEFVSLSQALAGFENEEPLVEILSMQISNTADDVELQRVSMNVRNTVTQ
jgi:hypothetical protein